LAYWSFKHGGRKSNSAAAFCVPKSHAFQIMTLYAWLDASLYVSLCTLFILIKSYSTILINSKYIAFEGKKKQFNHVVYNCITSF